MAGSDENKVPDMINHSNSTINNNNNIQGGLQARGGGKEKVMAPIGHNRRALRDINYNISGLPPYKRPTFEKNVGPEKIHQNPVPGHRPVTRKFAAQGNDSVQHNVVMIEEIMKQNHSEEVVVDDDCTIIDEDQYEAANDTSVPMFVQHTAAMLDEIDRMDEEVDMEDIDEPIWDIDSADKNNALAVTEYVDDIYEHYRKAESAGCVPTKYMEGQADINERMRAILIDWLIEVHYKFELMEETLYLTVQLIDRFLALQPVMRKKLQLVGVTAMLLASKYEEVSVPVVEDLVLISDKAYSRQEVLQMERLMINSLQFNLSIPTPYAFMRRFLKAAEANNKLEFLSYFLIELCLIEYEMLKFLPSHLAAAAVFTAQCTLSGSTHWNKTCEWHTGYAKEQLLECSKLMVTFHQKAGTGKLTGVQRKYNTSKFGHAAKCAPALFLLDPLGFNGWKCIT